MNNNAPSRYNYTNPTRRQPVVLYSIPENGFWPSEILNKTISTCYALALTAIIFASCSGPAKKEMKNITPAGTVALHTGDENYFAVDSKESLVIWKGRNTFGTHEGFVSISKGELLVEGGQLKEGIVEVNMTTIEDENHDNTSNLIRHLKDPDFFDVTLFPKSTMKITGIETTKEGNNMVAGDLTIKGISHPVSFPALIDARQGIVKASGRLVIDRTKWGIRYNSGKFFDNLKDQAIDDSIELVFKIVAKK